MTRTPWLAALILTSASLPCSAQFGGMGGGMGGMGGGRAARLWPVEEWTVKVEVRNDLSVTGRLKLQGVAVQCDLGLYRIKPGKVKAIEFDPRREEPLIVGPEGSQRRGVVVTASGEKIAGIISVPEGWEVETDLGSLKPEAQNLKSISFLGRVNSGPPNSPDSEVPIGKPGRGRLDRNEPQKPD